MKIGVPLSALQVEKMPFVFFLTTEAISLPIRLFGEMGCGTLRSWLRQTRIRFYKLVDDVPRIRLERSALLVKIAFDHPMLFTNTGITMKAIPLFEAMNKIKILHVTDVIDLFTVTLERFGRVSELGDRAGLLGPEVR